MGLLHARLAKYDLPQKMMEKGIYPYFRQITSKQGTEVTMHIDGAPLEPFRQAAADFQFLVFGKEGTLDADIGVLAVEGTDFDGELAAGKQGFGLAVAGHRLDHNRILVFRTAKLQFFCTFVIPYR